MQNITVKASEFKAKCLHMMDDVTHSGQTIIITKHGKPVAKMVPYQTPSAALYGFLQGQIDYNSDDVMRCDNEWEAWDEARNLE